MDGWMDRRTDGWIDGQIDRQMNKCVGSRQGWID